MKNVQLETCEEQLDPPIVSNKKPMGSSRPSPGTRGRICRDNTDAGTWSEVCAGIDPVQAAMASPFLDFSNLPLLARLCYSGMDLDISPDLIDPQAPKCCHDDLTS